MSITLLSLVLARTWPESSASKLLVETPAIQLKREEKLIVRQRFMRGACLINN
jgi:hypothetical protein